MRQIKGKVVRLDSNIFLQTQLSRLQVDRSVPQIGRSKRAHSVSFCLTGVDLESSACSPSIGNTNELLQVGGCSPVCGESQVSNSNSFKCDPGGLLYWKANRGRRESNI